MKERQNTIMLASSRGLFHPERGMSENITQFRTILIECGGKDIFLSNGKTHDIIYDRE